jgi:hypothetical protein
MGEKSHLAAAKPRMARPSIVYLISGAQLINQDANRSFCDSGEDLDRGNETRPLAPQLKATFQALNIQTEIWPQLLKGIFQALKRTNENLAYLQIHRNMLHIKNEGIKKRSKS